jgi:hypothetical protein
LAIASKDRAYRIEILVLITANSFSSRLYTYSQSSYASLHQAFHLEF